MSSLNKLLIVLYNIILLVLFPVASFANNLSISNITLADRSPSASTVTVQLDLSWDNSWKTKINHDAIWVTVRLHDSTVSPTTKLLCELNTAGLNPIDTDPGSNTDLEIYVPADKKGAFVRPSSYGFNASVTTTAMELEVDFDSCDLDSADNVYVSIFALEMVYIPEGSFYAGDNSTSTASFEEGSSDTDPWYISSESALSVSNPSSDGYRYVSAGNTSEDATGTSFTVGADYPKGYGAFYVMKHEITEGQWVEFVNSLPSAEARANRDLTDASHKNSDSVFDRNTISCSGSPLTCTTNRPYRTIGYLSWMDLAAFLDWAALRPMTELEFEKMSRGPLLAVNGEYAWGTTNITAAATISGTDEDGTETITTTDANGHYDNTTMSGGDTSNGSEYETGPLRNGIFATSSTSRETAGAGYYGVMELSGNVRERVATVGNATGRLFEGSHGDGTLTTTSGYEGNASEIDWPGMNAITSYGVTGADGAGLRGGGYDDASSRLRISDRNDAANGSTTAPSNAGGRGVRTYDGS